MVYIDTMIITANTVIDNSHLNAFKADCEAYKTADGPKSTYRGTGDLEGTTIVMKKIRTPQGNGFWVVVSNNKDIFLVCKLIAAPVPQGALPWGRKIYVMDSIKVHNNFIGRNLAPTIYTWLSENGYTIMSDSHQNTNSLAVWHKLGKKGNVFTVNINDGTWRSYDPLKIEDWMLFGNNDQTRYWPIRLVLPAK
jgi:hypothetical protein